MLNSFNFTSESSYRFISVSDPLTFSSAVCIFINDFIQQFFGKFLSKRITVLAVKLPYNIFTIVFVVNEGCKFTSRLRIYVSSVYGISVFFFSNHRIIIPFFNFIVYRFDFFVRCCESVFDNQTGIFELPRHALSHRHFHIINISFRERPTLSKSFNLLQTFFVFQHFRFGNSHINLRVFILMRIDRVYRLHRLTFPYVKVFVVIINQDGDFSVVLDKLRFISSDRREEHVFVFDERHIFVNPFHFVSDSITVCR